MCHQQFCPFVQPTNRKLIILKTFMVGMPQIQPKMVFCPWFFVKSCQIYTVDYRVVVFGQLERNSSCSSKTIKDSPLTHITWPSTNWFTRKHSGAFRNQVTRSSPCFVMLHVTLGKACYLGAILNSVLS